MRRLGWFARLCIVASLWWLPIGTLWLTNRENTERNDLAMHVSDSCQRSASSQPADRISAEMDRCFKEAKQDFGRIADQSGEMLRNNFGFALGICLLGWVVAWLLYASVAFVLAGRKGQRTAP